MLIALRNGVVAARKSGSSLEAAMQEVHLPAYAGNLDIMTSAALRTAESMAERQLAAVAA